MEAWATKRRVIQITFLMLFMMRGPKKKPAKEPYCSAYYQHPLWWIQTVFYVVFTLVGHLLCRRARIDAGEQVQHNNQHLALLKMMTGDCAMYLSRMDFGYNVDTILNCSGG